MRIKRGVSLRGIRPETVAGMVVADGVWARHDSELVITSGTEGSHSRNSLHYAGLAFDCRIWDFEETPGEVRSVADDLREALQAEYDVVIETSHIHVEYQPEKAMHL